MNSNFSKPEYYYKYIIYSFIVFTIIQLLIWIFSQEEVKVKQAEETSCHSDLKEKLLDENIISRGTKLKFKYMSAYLLSKAAMWAKAPYTFILFSNYYGFTFGQIGVLYIIDAFCSLFSGPFIGIMADTFGRKIVALYYPLNTVVIILMRISGVVPLAYAAQIFTGFAANVLSTSFEAWLNYEINKLFKDFPDLIQSYRKDIFSRISFYDSILSLFTAITGATIYSYLGIFYSLSLSIFLAICSAIVILISWDENKPNEENTGRLFHSLRKGMALLKYPQVLALGLIDSIYYCSLQIKMFSWTPVLQETAHTKEINVAMLFLIFTSFILIHNKLLEFLNKVFKVNFTWLAFVYLIFFLFNWFVVYYYDNYPLRMMCLAILNGSNGLMIPVIAFLRSNILLEQYRALLMNIFRIPLNFLLIIIFMLTNYLNPFQLCLIIGYLVIIPVLASCYLIYYQYTKKDDENVFIELVETEKNTNHKIA